MGVDTADVAGSSVQIGDPIVEKGLIDVVIDARDARLYNAITDCGAGGLSSAVGEMADELGAEVDLAAVPLKYAGLAPWEIWLSEAQERMVMAVPDPEPVLAGSPGVGVSMPRSSASSPAMADCVSCDSAATARSSISTARSFTTAVPVVA